MAIIQIIRPNAAALQTEAVIVIHLFNICWSEQGQGNFIT